MLKIHDAGKRLIVGVPGVDVTPEARFALTELGAGGIVLFSRNFESPEQLRDLVRRYRELCRHDRLVVAVDQEGGKVQRLRAPFTEWPDARAFAEAGNAGDIARFARFLARELAAVDIDLDFAPVCDVLTWAQNPVIGRRAFSSDANEVAGCVRAFIDAMKDEGVMACAKHAPGHGDTEADSHVALPQTDADARRLAGVELVPFAEAARAGVAAMMTAHVIYRGIDREWPATLTSRVLDLVRALPFDGPLISDDLEMAAIADNFGVGEGAVLALLAGCDLLLVCHRADRQEEAAAAIYDAMRGRRWKREAIWDSDKRLVEWNRRFPPRTTLPPLSVIGHGEHEALAEKVRSASG
ncbi:beta-N-acetylhexosaminidase [bacterium]|nr:beta-N-acetylhexosaminidase [bacterium]